MLLLLALACKPTPASLVLAPADDVLVWTADALPLPTVRVLDADGKTIDEPPPTVWTVAPPGFATIKGKTVKPYESGQGTIQACAGPACMHYVLRVTIPDRMTLVANAKELPVGAVAEFVTTLTSSGKPLDGPEIFWASSDASVLTLPTDCVGSCAGTAGKPGTVMITVTSGVLSASTTLTVRERTGAEACDPACADWTQCVATCSVMSFVTFGSAGGTAAPDAVSACVTSECAGLTPCTTSCSTTVVKVNP